MRWGKVNVGEAGLVMIVGGEVWTLETTAEAGM